MMQTLEKRRTVLRVVLGLALCAAGLAGVLFLAPFKPQTPSHSQQSDSSPALSAPTTLPALPASRILPLWGFSQLPELPNGCEGTSLAILLNYYGFPAGKMEIALDYIPRTTLTQTWHGLYGGDPETSYCGDPTGVGYYCYARPLQQAADAYLAEHGSGLRALDMTGCTAEQLRQAVADGRPAAVWVTIDMEPILMSERTWQLYRDGSVYRPQSNLHCVVLYGYDESSYYLYDPLYGPRQVSRLLFELRWRQMGSRALTLDHSPYGLIPAH